MNSLDKLSRLKATMKFSNLLKVDVWFYINKQPLTAANITWPHLGHQDK